MARWLSPSEDKKKHREHTFKAFLWLPKDIAEELSGVLSHKSGDYRKLIGMVREHLLEEEIASEKLDYINVIGFGLTPKENSIKKSNEASNLSKDEILDALEDLLKNRRKDSDE